MNMPSAVRVVIIGAGPTGLTLANLLGAEGVATLLVERNPGCVTEPRAVALDGECLRTLQAVGLADTVLENIRRKDSKRSTAQSPRDSSTSLWSERAPTMVRSNWQSELSSRPLRSSICSLIRTHWRSSLRLSCREEPERTQQESDPAVPSGVKPSM